MDYKADIEIVIILFGIIAILFFLVKKYIKNLKRKNLISSGIHEVDIMTGEQFEIFLKAHFENLKYRVQTTPKTNDYGADLILKRDGEITAVQAKRWKGSVGIKAVQEVIAAMKYYHAKRGIVVTNSYFTKNAINLAKADNVYIIDRNKLIEIISDAQGKRIIEKLKLENTQYKAQNNICPECGSELKQRYGKTGVFIGCSSFPNCKFTKNI